jgi:ketosteroid isomerase-like protein
MVELPLDNHGGSVQEMWSEYFKAWDSLDLEAVLSFFTDDIVYEDTTVNHGATGAKQMRRFVQASFDNVPDAHFDYVGHVNTDTGFAVEWVMQPMNVRGVSIGKLRDGKICEQRDYWNGALFVVPNT